MFRTSLISRAKMIGAGNPISSESMFRLSVFVNTDQNLCEVRI